jgi:hypothetical protein
MPDSLDTHTPSDPVIPTWQDTPVLETPSEGEMHATPQLWEDALPWTESTQTPNEDVVVISANSAFEGHKLRNFYMTNAFQGFVWMIFHFSVVFFFTFQLESVALVGIFLGVANAIAFFLDIPVGILQRYYSTKKTLYHRGYLTAHRRWDIL